MLSLNELDLEKACDEVDLTKLPRRRAGIDWWKYKSEVFRLEILKLKATVSLQEQSIKSQKLVLGELRAENERLRIDRAFYEVAIKERDYERQLNERFRYELQRLCHYDPLMPKKETEE